jgi:HK97 family phage major capsid protein
MPRNSARPVDSELRYGIGIAEEEEILFGDGTGQHLTGIVTQAEVFNGDVSFAESPNRFDYLLGAIAQCQGALLPATGIVLNDIDMTYMRTTKDANNAYIVSGGPFGPPVSTIWQVPTVGTPVMPSGHSLSARSLTVPRCGTAKMSTRCGDRKRGRLRS